MFLKRFMVLAAGVVLFIVAFIAYFEFSNAQMESRFRAEREKFNVQGVTLTAAEPDIPPAPSTPGPAASSQAAGDTNTLIGPPVPPATAATPDAASSSSPDSTTPDSAPAPATNAPTPDSNSVPVAPVPSTSNEPRRDPASFFVQTSYRPGARADIPLIGLLSGAVASPDAADTSSPATNSVPATTRTPASAPETNASPSSAPQPAESATSSDHGGEQGSVIVLLYHQFKAPGVKIPEKLQWTLNQDVFASEMKYIHDNGYHVIPMSDLLRFLKHEITLPPNSVVLTIDDGYKSAIVYAAPILKQYGYPWTFFIYPEFITTGEGPGAASWNDLLALQADGVDIECHSMTHPKLNSHHQQIKGVWHNLSPEEYDAWLTNETAGAKAILEQKMGKKIICFAYPYGEYNKQVEDKVLAAGFQAIFTVAGNPIHSTSDPHSIGRYTITQSEVKYFESDLRQGALGLGEPDPAPGATTSNPRPVISAVLGYPGSLDPKSVDATVYGFDVRHDFDPKTGAVHLYLPRDLIQPVVPVAIRVRDARTGQLMVARWRFNYASTAAPAAPHAPINPATNSAAASTPTASPSTAAKTDPEPATKTGSSAPLEASPATH